MEVPFSVALYKPGTSSYQYNSSPSYNSSHIVPRQTTLGDFIGSPKLQAQNQQTHRSETLKYQYITEDDENLVEVLRKISGSYLIAVDCEGYQLGRHGELSLIQVATSDHVFLFDVQSLGSQLFAKGLKSIMERTVPVKVFYDCRRDSDILYHHFGVKLKGVVDAALTEVLYRGCNGMGVPRFLKGYKRSVETYLNLNDPHFLEVKQRVSALMSENGSTFWRERPIPQEFLDYAAYDVKYLRQLHVMLTERMPKSTIRVIYRASIKFVRMERDLLEITERDLIEWTQISPWWFQIY